MDNNTTTASGIIPDTPPLLRALSAQERNHSKLDDMLSALENRLAPLLRFQELADKEGFAGNAQKAQQQSEVVTTIEDFNYRMERYAERIKVLLERLEI